MSEFINNNQLRRDRLLELALGLLEGRRQSDFVKQFEDELEDVTPRDVVFIVDGMVKTGAEMDRLKKAVSQVINLMTIPLQPDEKRMWEDCPFLNAMVRENEEMEHRMKAIKQLVKTINVKGIEEDQLKHLKREIKIKLNELTPFEKHYIRKENILFPYLEKAWEDFRCLKVMWSMHDDVRIGLKLLGELLEDNQMSIEEFNYAIGTLYFSVYPLIYREENILFPIAFEELPDKAWTEMLEQSADIGYAFIQPAGQKPIGENAAPVKPISEDSSLEEGFIDFGTGRISVKQIEMIFNHLPLDITFIDDQDEVRYFNDSKIRHFPRSKAIIGRKVQNCHPPESMDVVNRIVDSFRNGTRDSEPFWIETNGKFIHVRYFAVRDEAGRYRGTLEVSQDVTEIRGLEGEKRLLDGEG